MSSSAATAHSKAEASDQRFSRAFDERAARGIDQALRLATGGLRVPAVFLVLIGPKGEERATRLWQTGVWESLEGTPGYSSLVSQVSAAAVSRAAGIPAATLRGRASVEGLGVLEYAALPLMRGGAGELRGVVAAIDRRQRDWGEFQDEILRDIAGIVSSELDWLDARQSAEETGGVDELISGLLQSSGEGIAVFDLERTCRVWNRFLERLTNRPASEVVGRPGAELERLFRIPDLDLLLSRAIHAGQSTVTDEQLYRTDAEDAEVWITARISPLRTGNGPISGAMVLLRDESERVRADQRRQRGERMFRKLIEHSSEMLSILAPDGTVLFDGPSNERILGYASDELVGRNAFEFIHPEDVERVRTAFDRVLDHEGASMTVEYRVKHKNQEWRQFLTVAQNLSSDPHVRGVVLNSRDISDWRAMEAQLNQAQKMDALGRLAGGVAHDFNNLLTAIKGNVQLLMLDLSPEEQGREELAEIDRVTDRAAALTRQLLSFGRRQTGSRKPLQVNSIVRQITRMLERLVGGIRLVVRTNDPLPAVLADPTQLEQVLVNLVVNARDAMNDGGTIGIETHAAELPPDLALAHPDASHGSYVCLEVRDSGSGMDRDTQARMFEPFFTTKSVGEGTGLGLATVYAIVRQSSGFIRVFSAPGEGTRVVIYLPSAPLAAAPNQT
jgi:PAS domain S-box-containing protein